MACGPSGLPLHGGVAPHLVSQGRGGRGGRDPPDLHFCRFLDRLGSWGALLATVGVHSEEDQGARPAEEGLCGAELGSLLSSFFLTRVGRPHVLAQRDHVHRVARHQLPASGLQLDQVGWD